MNAQELWEKSLANRAEGTRQKYFSHFKTFIEWCSYTPDQLREMKYEEDLTKKPWERNQVENLLRRYLERMEKTGYSCNTQNITYVAIKSFFEAQGMPLFLKRQDRPIGCAFGSKTLDHEEIRRLVRASEYLRDKALILFLKDSGLRLSDAAKLQWKDLKEYGNGFMGFEIQTKKKKTKARGFIGPEATEVLKLYKQKRLQGTQKLPPEENIEDHPVFALLTEPTKTLRPAIMSAVIGDIIRLAQIQGSTPHGLRKFWEQNMHVEKNAYQKQINGRALTQVERAYYWRETSDLFEMYKANYHNLLIEKSDFREAEDRLRRDYQKEIKRLKDRIYEMEREKEERSKYMQISPEDWKTMKAKQDEALKLATDLKQELTDRRDYNLMMFEKFGDKVMEIEGAQMIMFKDWAPQDFDIELGRLRTEELEKWRKKRRKKS